MRHALRGFTLRYFCYLAVVFVLWCVKPALGQPTVSDLLAEDGPRNWSHVLAAVSFLVSLVLAGVFVWRSKRSAGLKAIVAVCIVITGPMICHLAYFWLCQLLGKPDCCL